MRPEQAGAEASPPVSDCCGAAVKRAFYGAVICSECRSEVSVARDTEQEKYA